MKSKRKLKKGSSSIVIYSLHYPLLILLAVAVLLVLGRQISTSKASVEGAKSTTKFILDSGKDQITSNKIASVEKLLVATIAYDMSSKTPIKIADAQIKNGYSSIDRSFTDNYVMQLVSSDGRVLEKKSFIIPNKITEALQTKPIQGSTEVLLPKVNFAQSLKWSANAKRLQIVDSTGTVVTEYDLANIKQFNNPPSFKTMQTEKLETLLNTQLSKNQDSDTQDKVDIVFIGDDYLTEDDLVEFHDEVAGYINVLFNYEPFKTRASQFAFHIVDNTTIDLDCRPSTWGGPFFYCDDSIAYQTATNASVPLDKLVIVYNTTQYHRASAMVGVVGAIIDCCIHMPSTTDSEVFVHELGHLLGNLDDEYLVMNTDDENPSNSISRVNCFSGNAIISPPPAWYTLVGQRDYDQGCYYPNHYKTSVDSMMESNGPFFNSVSQKSLNDYIDYYAGSFHDDVPPTGALLSPANGSVARYIIDFKHSITDDNGIALIQLWRDGVLTYTDYNINSSNGFIWPIVDETLGMHTYQLKAFDVKGNVFETPPAVVEIKPKNDTTPPSPTILEPKKDQQVSGIVEIKANATDNYGYISTVTFSINGQYIGRDNTSPYSFLWDTTGVSLGNHSITVRAFDLAANSGTRSIPVKVVQPKETVPPVVLIDKPLNNTQVTNTKSVSILAYATDNVKVRTMKVFVNNKSIKTCTGSTVCKVSTAVSNLSVGENEIKVTAQDPAGNIGSAQITVIK